MNENQKRIEDLLVLINKLNKERLKYEKEERFEEAAKLKDDLEFYGMEFQRLEY